MQKNISNRLAEKNRATLSSSFVIAAFIAGSILFVGIIGTLMENKRINESGLINGQNAPFLLKEVVVTAKRVAPVSIKGISSID